MNLKCRHCFCIKYIIFSTDCQVNKQTKLYCHLQWFFQFQTETPNWRFNLILSYNSVSHRWKVECWSTEHKMVWWKLQNESSIYDKMNKFWKTKDSINTVKYIEGEIHIQKVIKTYFKYIFQYINNLRLVKLATI